GLQDPRDDVGHPVPVAGLLLQPPPAAGGEAIEAGLPLVLGFPPFALDEALALEAIEGGVERALLDLEALTRDLLDAEENAVSVARAEGHGLQDEHVEGALEEVRRPGHALSYAV